MTALPMMRELSLVMVVEHCAPAHVVVIFLSSGGNRCSNNNGSHCESSGLLWFFFWQTCHPQAAHTVCRGGGGACRVLGSMRLQGHEHGGCLSNDSRRPNGINHTWSRRTFWLGVHSAS